MLLCADNAVRHDHEQRLHPTQVRHPQERRGNGISVRYEHEQQPPAVEMGNNQGLPCD